ncbi:glycosyltransferase 25 family member [Prorops nasuta]|uniref:glycosyltransferase 25 family member n=1 Tax=Prorops nasuta TaxID=863751 RepID=UPI0034D00939
MKYQYYLPVLLVSNFLVFSKCYENLKEPTVLISILIRNKAHVLPYFLHFLEQQDYPKHRISLWIRSDNNIDNTMEILEKWLQMVEKRYNSININLDKSSKGFDDETSISEWSHKRFSHVMKLREDALDHARKIWADYIWMLDADVLLTNNNTLQSIISKKKTVVAPMLKSDGMYSNFWAGMTYDFYYLRTDKYEPILFQEEVGCFDVPMIHSAVLIDLRRISSDYLTYKSSKLKNYMGPEDDIIIFALSALVAGISLNVCNEEEYGFIMIPLDSKETMEEDNQRLMNLKIEILMHRVNLSLPMSLQKFVAYLEPNTMGFDHIYMINLMRRPERRERMEFVFQELGLSVETFAAVDGSVLSKKSLDSMSIKFVPEYMDPYHKRPMTMGEIGCFLSHYEIWKKVLHNNYSRIMVLEDDVRFEPYFRQKIEFVLKEIETFDIDWDLVYIGRKRLVENQEVPVENSRHLVYAAYSYWTLGYLLSASGAKKLIDANPLSKLVPVDEYIPILSDMHPREDWKKHFSPRNLVVLSTDPLLIHPTHYTGEKGYISDTEDSTIVKNFSEEDREEL